jgi:hypothetical protein
LRRGKLQARRGVLFDEQRETMSDKSTDISADTETQQRMAALVRSLDVSAPASLHASIGELAAHARHGGRARHAWAGPAWVARARPLALIAGTAALVGVAILLLVLALSPGGPAAPTVLQASALALRPATLNAPEENPSTPGLLAISVDGISYPYWESRFGLQTAGARSDRLGGRAVTTVFYAGAGGKQDTPLPRRPGTHAIGPSTAERIGYSIVAGPALAVPDSGHTVVWHGVRFQLLSAAGSTVVTWRRAGHTCILVGSGVSSRTLLTLANS